jgi:hypothetical protein
MAIGVKFEIPGGIGLGGVQPDVFAAYNAATR